MGYLDRKCPVSGKIRYRDHHSATLRLKKVRRVRSRVPEGAVSTDLVNRSYRCPDCKGWHLTSQPAWVAAPRVSMQRYPIDVGTQQRRSDMIIEHRSPLRGPDAVILLDERFATNAC